MVVSGEYCIQQDKWNRLIVSLPYGTGKLTDDELMVVLAMIEVIIKERKNEVNE